MFCQDLAQLKTILNVKTLVPRGFYLLIVEQVASQPSLSVGSDSGKCDRKATDFCLPPPQSLPAGLHEINCFEMV